MVARPLKRPLTIVQLLPDLISGGVERGTLEIGAFLADQGHRSIVISNGGPMVVSLLDNGSEHIKMPIGQKSPMTLMCIPKLRQVFISENVDIIHLRSRVPAWAGLIAAKSISEKNRPKIITTFHGFYSINKYSAVMTKGELVIAVSNPIKDHIQTVYKIPESKIQLINRGVDTIQFGPGLVSVERENKLKKEWGLDHKTGPFIILPGRFTRLKGHSLLIEALEKIKQLSWTTIFIGDENENPRYAQFLKQAVKKSGLEQKIIFAGHVNDMPAAYKISDLTISASIYPESFGRVAIESQAMGVPVIATALGGSLETIRDKITGWLCPCKDVDLFSKALTEAISNPEIRKKYGRQGQKWVLENFTTQQMCEQTVSVYHRLMDKGLGKN